MARSTGQRFVRSSSRISGADVDHGGQQQRQTLGPAQTTAARAHVCAKKGYQCRRPATLNCCTVGRTMSEQAARPPHATSVGRKFGNDDVETKATRTTTTTAARGTLRARNVHDGSDDDDDNDDDTAIVGWSAAAAAAGLTFLPSRWWCPDDAAPRTGASARALCDGRARAPPLDGNGCVCATRQRRRTVCLRTVWAGGRGGGSAYDGGVAHRAATDCSLQQWLSGRRCAAAVDAQPPRGPGGACVLPAYRSAAGAHTHAHARYQPAAAAAHAGAAVMHVPVCVASRVCRRQRRRLFRTPRADTYTTRTYIPPSQRRELTTQPTHTHTTRYLYGFCNKLFTVQRDRYIDVDIIIIL